MTTVKDVAKEAGVSLGTVSNVLNGKEGVKDENREKVYRAMKKLGFHKGNAVSSKKTRATMNIGLIVPSIENPFFGELARGVEDEAEKNGYTIFLCNGDRDVNKERKYVNALLAKGIDGLIIVKPQLTLRELKKLSSYIILVVEDWDKDWENDFLGVSANDYVGVIQGMNLLNQYGHRRIAFISGPIDSYSSRCKKKAYEQCLESWGIQYRPEYMAYGDYSWDSGYETAKTFMNLSPMPTAIFAANDMMAMGAMKAAQVKGLRIPDDISVLGYDDIQMSRLCSPALTTIHQPKYQVGVASVKLLRKALNGEDITGEKGKIMLETKIVMRESVSYAPGYVPLSEKANI